MTLAPRSCADEYVYRHYYSIFRPQYEVVWFDRSGKVIGEQQHVELAVLKDRDDGGNAARKVARETGVVQDLNRALVWYEASFLR